MYSWLATKLCCTKNIVHTEHSYDYFVNSKKLHLYGKFFLNKPAKVVGVTEDVSSYIRKQYKIPDSKLVTIYNGIDINQFNQGSTIHYREELGIDKNAFVIGTIGRLEPIKNQEALITSFSRIKKDVPNSILFIVGDGSMRNSLEKTAANLGLTSSIKFLGLRRDIPMLLKAMDVFVLSSYSEGLSLALLEAMASGIPVIASEVGGNPNIVTNGNTGILFDLNKPDELTNSLKQLSRDPSLRKSISANALALVNSKYSLEKMIKRYENIYREIQLGYKK
jgi:glycosyltransferase involved in cell wall biosynthesis